MNNQEKADDIVYRAYQMGSGDDFEENAFPMYSYDRAAYEFWGYFVESLLDKGATVAECEEVLRSKLMRWMFDNPPEQYIKAVKDMAETYYIKEARKWMKEEKANANN